MSYVERAEAGAKLLDEREPGWRERVDLSQLDMGDECFCILGQVYGTYRQGQAALFGPEADDEVNVIDRQRILAEAAERHGFTDLSDDDRCWYHLNGTWAALLQRSQ